MTEKDNCNCEQQKDVYDTDSTNISWSELLTDIIEPLVSVVVAVIVLYILLKLNYI